MKNLPPVEKIKSEEALPKCKATIIVEGKLVECLESEPLCQHYIHFGNSIYCIHPMNLEIAKRTHKKNEH